MGNEYRVIQRKLLCWKQTLSAERPVLDTMEPVTARIAVAGAGVIGLSSAVAIQERCPGVKVTLIADSFDKHTTSHGAGGLFMPVALGVEDELHHLWASESARYFYDLAFSPKSVECGVMPLSGFFLHFSDEPERYLKHMLNLSKMSEESFRYISPSGKYKGGYFVTTAMVDGVKYLPWMMNRFVSNGGKVVEKSIHSFGELVGQYDLVINCTGLRSRHLTHDPDLHPIRGQLARVDAPWIKNFIHTDDHILILPTTDTVGIGGVRQVGREEMTISPSEHKDMYAKAKELFPALEGAKFLYDWVGLRPGRSKIRLEPEVIHFKGKSLTVIHNYGHGAYGVSLSWGTGVHVAQMVQSMISSGKAKL